MAYQGYGRQLALEALRMITAFATGGLVPDLTLYFDIAPEEGLRRRQAGGGEWNRLDAETADFHQRARAGYLELIRQEPERWVVIDANRSREEVQAKVRAAVQARMGQGTCET
jgi:dTMP kinase